MSEKINTVNELETEDLHKLLHRFCIPALISSLVTSVYNIVDQLFVGNTVGMLGNAATNVVFPAVTLITALSLMCGVGTSAGFNLAMGRGDRKTAARTIGGGFILMFLSGLIVSLILLLFTEPVLYLFGCTDEIWPYAAVYGRITALAFVFAMIGAAGPFVIRADGSPAYALWCVIIGNAVNAVLDALFILVFHWGIAGAAWATVIGEAAGALMVLVYLPRFRNFKLSRDDFRFDGKLLLHIGSLGAGPAINFLTQVLVQIMLNHALKEYGSQSIYGAEAVLAAVGVANKVNTLAAAVVQGFTNGMQPIVSYNYGRKNYARVKEIVLIVLKRILLLGFCIFLLYQLFPRQITRFFGDGTEEYFAFAELYFRIFLLLIPLNGLQSSIGGFFSAQGRPGRSILISLTRQVFLLPVFLMILPGFWGIAGILWSGPLADLGMSILAVLLLNKELNRYGTAENHAV